MSNVISKSSNKGSDYFVDVALGRISGFSMAAITGVNTTLSNSSFEDISDQGGTVTPLSVAGVFDLVTSGNDTVAGTGVQFVAATFLDEDWEPVTVIKATTGGTSAFTGNFLRCVSIIGIQSGSLGWNDNNVDVEVTGGGQVHLRMVPANNSAFPSFYSVQAGRTARVVNVSTFVAKNDEIQFQPYLIGQNGNFISGQPIPLFEGSVNQRLLSPFPITQKQDFVFRGKSLSAGTSNTSIIAEILLEVVPVTANP